jgi:hypothetical protein
VREGEQLYTEDIYLGALGLTRGGELSHVEVRKANGRSLAVFYIDGPDMVKTERDYYHGAVSVDLRHLKAEVVRLKNLAFRALREEENRCRSARTGSNGSSRPTTWPR